MRTKFCAPALLCSALISLSAAADSWQVSSSGTWQLNEDPAFALGKGSASNLLRLNEALPHHKVTLEQRDSITSRFSLSFSCMLQSPTPVLELRVPALDIALNDTVRGYAFARFMVDDNQEMSLRAEIQAPNRLIFAPFTAAQERSLSSLFLQLREGGVLHAALLQGKSAEPRRYNFPLSGFMEFADIISADCRNLNAAAGGEVSYLPDYLTVERADAAPKDFSLKPKPTDGLEPKVSQPAVQQVQVPSEPDLPPAPDFRPDGSPAAIGPDGRPVGADNQNGAAGGSFGTASGPMIIGDDGMPQTGSGQ